MNNISFMQEKKTTDGKFFERLSELMETSGLKQKEIAEEIGTTATALIHWKSGRSTPGGTELYKIAKFFGCTMEWLIAGEDDGKPSQAIAMWKNKAEEAEKKVEAMKAGLTAFIKKF